jgi:hypothetical protein
MNFMWGAVDAKGGVPAVGRDVCARARRASRIALGVLLHSDNGPGYHICLERRSREPDLVISSSTRDRRGGVEIKSRPDGIHD